MKVQLNAMQQENCKKLIIKAMHVISAEAFDALNFLMEQTPYLLNQHNLRNTARELKRNILTFQLSSLNEDRRLK